MLLCCTLADKYQNAAKQHVQAESRLGLGLGMRAPRALIDCAVRWPTVQGAGFANLTLRVVQQFAWSLIGC